MATAADEAIGLVRRALLLRAKYRVQSEKLTIPLSILAVHPDNRAGVYPMEDTVINLGLGILLSGFSVDEANHEGVCVQEVPAEEQRKLQVSTTEVYETYLAYNMRKTAAVAALQTVFSKAHSIAYGTLSHSHLLLILLAMSSGARWPIQEGSPYEPLKKLQDPDGKWNMTAVAAKDENFKELVQSGLRMEVLSWKILVEEPGGCSLIAQAMNKGQALALRSSEITALSAVAGAVTMVQAQAELSLSFEAVKERVRDELDMWVDDPEFIDLFEFVVTMGGKEAGFVDGFLDFASKFVDSKQRQLRLVAFATVNKMPSDTPRAKVAVLMRAYRKPPSRTWCPCPEGFWPKADKASLLVLEQALHYFHGTCKSAVADMAARKLQLLMANTNCVAAETYARWYSSKSSKLGTLKHDLLVALSKYFEEVASHCNAKNDPNWIYNRPPTPKPVDDWIDFAAVAANSASAASSGKIDKDADKMMPKVLVYDPVTGKPTTQQDERQAAGKEAISVEVVPWKAWCATEVANRLGLDAAYQAAITMVLRAHHVSGAEQKQDVELCVDAERKRWVRAEKAFELKSLRLYPCAPKGLRLLAHSDHPHRATFEVREAAEGGGGNLETRQFYLNPELRLPEAKKSASAVAEGASAVADALEWAWTGEESLYPYWAVTRLSGDEMRKMQAEQETLTARFNVEVIKQEFANVTVGCERRNMTLHVVVPVLTNIVALRKGERLYLEVVAKAKSKKKAPETWRTDASKAKVPKHGTDGPQCKAKAKGKAKSAMEFGTSMDI